MSTAVPPVKSGYSPDIGRRLARLKLVLSGQLKQGPYSRTTQIGLRRDLTLPLERPNAKIPISVRPLVAADLDVLLPQVANEHPEALELMWRRNFVRKAPRGCFVAIDMRTDVPCYMQWLFSARDNETVSAIGGFPRLEPDQALLENAYTPPSHRGLGIMSAAMALIAEAAEPMGARYVFTYVGVENVASLKGCHRAGFHPHLLHHRSRLAFGLLKFDRFEPMPDAPPVSAG